MGSEHRFDESGDSIMSLGGFLTIPQNADARSIPLPVSDEVTYTDGFAGTVPGSQSIITSLQQISRLRGDMTGSIEQDGSKLVFILRLIQSGVYGFGMIDSILVLSSETIFEPDKFSSGIQFDGLNPRFYRGSSFKRRDS